MIISRASRTRRIVAVAVLSAIALAACSGDDPTPVTTSPPEPMTIEDLDAAVRSAAAALLAIEDVDATTIYFNRDEPERVLRYDWMTARANGDHIVVSNDLNQRAVTAIVQVGPNRYRAAAMAEQSQPWDDFGPALPQPEGTPPLVAATNLADGAVLTMRSGAGGIEVTRQRASDGSVLWRLARSSGNSAEVVFTAEWIIDKDGALWFYRSESDDAELEGSVQAFVIGFSIPEDPSPIDPPTPGARLDLEELGVPEDLLALNDED